MDTRKLSGWSLFITLLLLAAGSVWAVEPHSTGFADATGVDASPGAGAPWFDSEVDSGPLVGAYVSVAINDSGTTYISYYDMSNADLKMAKYVGSGGNCGPNNDWSCEIVESSGSVGRFSSIAIDPTTNLPVIAYMANNDVLRVATAWSGGWDIRSIDTLDGYTSLQIDSTGAAHIAYKSYGRLLYAKRVGSGGDCAGSAYRCNTIDDCPGSCAYPSLALDSSDQPRIAYYDTSGGDLWYAQPGIPGNCGPGDSWGCYQVDSTSDVGQHASLDVDSGGLPHVAYYDATNGKLKYAVVVGAGGNCGPLSSWQCDEIATMGVQSTHPRTRDVSLALDKAGLPFIAYSWYYGTPYSGRGFAWVRPAAALGLPSGNCDPQDLWQCEGIQSGYSMGNYAAVAFNHSGLATIAYYYDNSGTIFEGDLRVAYQRFYQVYLPLVMSNR